VININTKANVSTVPRIADDLLQQQLNEANARMNAPPPEKEVVSNPSLLFGEEEVFVPPKKFSGLPADARLLAGTDVRGSLPELMPNGQPIDDIPEMYSGRSSSQELMPNGQPIDDMPEMPDQATQEDGGFGMENFGLESTDEDYYSKLQQERQSQMEARKILDPSRWENEEGIRSAYGEGAVKATEAGAINRTAMSITNGLNDLDIGLYKEGTTTNAKLNGLTYLKQGTGLDTKQVGNAATTSFILLAPMLSGAASQKNGEIQSTEDNADISELDKLLMDDGDGPLNKVAIDGGLKRDMVEKNLGRLFKKLSKGVGDTYWGDTERVNQNLSNEAAGATIGQALVDKGFLIEDVDPQGTEILRLSPGLGAELRFKSKGMQRSVTGALSGKAQKAPPTETGAYQGARQDVRGMDKQKNEYTATKEMAEAKGAVAKVPLFISPVKSYFAALFNEAILSHVKNPANPAPLDVMGLLKVSEEDIQDASVNGNKTAAEVIDQKVSNLQTELGDMAKHVAYGGPQWSTYWEDYATHRMYQDATDFNPQRNKWTRALTVGKSAPIMLDSEYHNTGVSKVTAEGFLNRIAGKARGGNFTLSPAEKELSFLLTLGRVLDSSKSVGMSSESILLPNLLQTVTPEFIAEAAAKGRLLRSIVPTNTREVVNALGKPEGLIEKLTPAQKGAVDNFLKEADRDDWGYKLQAYLDAANYLDAKLNGIPFTPRLTVALDMNSAGRSFLASDVGNMDILSRVGLVWDRFIDRVNDMFVDTLPNEKGDPRYYFTTVALDQGVASAFGDAQSDKVEMFKILLNKYGGAGVAGNKQFNKDFSKKVLMTTDYGKPANFHIAEAQAFLKSHPEFRDEALRSYNGDVNALAKDINEIYKATLKHTTDSWQYTLPKKMVKYLQMFGRVPKPIGYWNENISIGRFGNEPTGNIVQIKGAEGNRRRIMETARMFDPLAPAKAKGLRLDDGSLFIPEEGSAAVNQVGPTFGQYRESIIVAETARLINGKKTPADSSFIIPVFDNFIVDSMSYPFVHYVANNIVAPKVFEWNMAKGFTTDFIKQLKEAVPEMMRSDEIIIGPGSPYKGIFTTVDREYKWLKDKKPNELAEYQKKLKEFLESKSSGYVPPGPERSESTRITKAQAKALVDQMYKYYYFNSNNSGIFAWENPFYKGKRDPFLKELKARAAKGLVYFFT
jgi:hypothetical protein